MKIRSLCLLVLLSLTILNARAFDEGCLGALSKANRWRLSSVVSQMFGIRVLSPDHPDHVGTGLMMGSDTHSVETVYLRFQIPKGITQEEAQRVTQAADEYFGRRVSAPGDLFRTIVGAPKAPRLSIAERNLFERLVAFHQAGENFDQDPHAFFNPFLKCIIVQVVIGHPKRFLQAVDSERPDFVEQEGRYKFAFDRLHSKREGGEDEDASEIFMSAHVMKPEETLPFVLRTWTGGKRYYLDRDGTQKGQRIRLTRSQLLEIFPYGS